MTADVDMKVMLAGYNRTDGDKTAYYAPSDTDPATVSAFDLAFVTKIGDTDQPKPYGYVTANDISLANKGSVTLMIPGAVGAMYWINGGLDGVIKDVSVISVDRIGGTLGSDEKPITLNTDNVAKYPSSTTPQLPLSQANAYNYWLYGGLTGDTILHFGEAYICKITDATGNLLRVDGDIQAFKSLEDGFKAYKDNALNAYTTKDNTPAAPAYIKMLVEDYDLKLDRVVSDYKNSIAAPVNKPLILTTASSDDEELPGPYKGTEATRCVINRGAISKGSTFSVPKNANLTTENIIFDGDAEFEDDIYKSGEVAVNGVIVNVASGGTLTLGEGTTMRNSAVKSDANKGGAIYADKDSILSITGTPTNWVTFMDCQAKGGGAINNPGDNGFGGTVAIEYCSFSHCYAKGRDDTNASGPCAGGAVRCMANTLTLSHCVFTVCSTVQQGGALYHKGGTEFRAEYCTFTRCSCYDPKNSVQAAAGGAESQAKTVTVDYCTFTECTSSKNAGGFNVFNTGATINVKNSKFVGCSANGKKDTGDFGNGGALRTTGSSTTVENCTFEGCSASNRGGAIHCKTTTTIKGTTSISNCSATNYGGGAVYLQTGTLTIESVNVEDCKAPDGGAIYQGGGTCNFNGGDIVDCKAVSPSANANGCGGGVYLTKGNFKLNGGTIEKCSADRQGGGVYLGGGTVEMTNGEIGKCNAEGNGGGVCLNATGATYNLKGGKITECNSVASGGGVYLGGGKLTFSNGEIVECCAKTGGGVYINGTSTANISKNGVAIKDCKALDVSSNNETGESTVAGEHDEENLGGGLYQNGGTLTITKATIEDCSAYDGGGIYLNGNSSTELKIGEEGKTSGGDNKGLHSCR